MVFDEMLCEMISEMERYLTLARRAQWAVMFRFSIFLVQVPGKVIRPGKPEAANAGKRPVQIGTVTIESSLGPKACPTLAAVAGGDYNC